jgi:hypothetical protein
MILKIGNRAAVEVASFEQASRIYAQYRDASLEGASTFPNGVIVDGTRIIARVSYNARVWPPGKWTEDQTPLFDPQAARGAKDAHTESPAPPGSVHPASSEERAISYADAIVIHGPEPGYNRFKVARDIQNACNTSGVARELIRVIEDAARDPNCGRGRLTHDPAVAAVVDKLRSLMALDPYDAHEECAWRAS